jgi:hypothetical protein
MQGICGYGAALTEDKMASPKDRKSSGKSAPKVTKTPQADFDRNRDGLYGGLPKARDTTAPGPGAKEPHPPARG